MNPQVEKFLKLPFYQRLLVVLGVAAVLIGLFVYLLFLPKLDEYKGLIAKSETLQGKILESRRIADNLPKFQQEYEKMQARLEQALTELPNDKEIPTLLTNLASLAKDNGLEVRRFKPGNEVPKGFYAEVPVELALTGSYHQVGKFFYDVSEMSRIVNIGNVTLGGAKPVGKGEERMNLEIACLATTFRFVSNPQQPAGGAQKK